MITTILCCQFAVSIATPALLQADAPALTPPSQPATRPATRPASQLASQPSRELPVLIVHKRATKTEPRVDASTDDPAWADAANISSLELCVGPAAKQMRPTPTEVRVTWNEQFLFVRFIAVDDDLYAPNGTRNDLSHSSGDVDEIFLDPIGDGRQFFEIQCNPVGGWVDAMHVLTTRPTSGSDGVLDSEVMRRDTWFFLGWEIPGIRIAAAPFGDTEKRGWIADFALPAKPILHRLGLSKFKAMEMRINFVRYDAAHPNANKDARTIEMAWSPVAWGRPHRSPARMGTLKLRDD